MGGGGGGGRGEVNQSGEGTEVNTSKWDGNNNPGEVGGTWTTNKQRERDEVTQSGEATEVNTPK